MDTSVSQDGPGDKRKLDMAQRLAAWRAAKGKDKHNDKENLRALSLGGHGHELKPAAQLGEADACANKKRRSDGCHVATPRCGPRTAAAAKHCTAQGPVAAPPALAKRRRVLEPVPQAHLGGGAGPQAGSSPPPVKPKRPPAADLAGPALDVVGSQSKPSRPGVSALRVAGQASGPPAAPRDPRAIQPAVYVDVMFVEPDLGPPVVRTGDPAPPAAPHDTRACGSGTVSLDSPNEPGSPAVFMDSMVMDPHQGPPVVRTRDPADPAAAPDKRTDGPACSSVLLHPTCVDPGAAPPLVRTIDPATPAAPTRASMDNFSTSVTLPQMDSGMPITPTMAQAPSPYKPNTSIIVPWMSPTEPDTPAAPPAIRTDVPGAPGSPPNAQAVGAGTPPHAPPPDVRALELSTPAMSVRQMRLDPSTPFVGHGLGSMGMDASTPAGALHTGFVWGSAGRDTGTSAGGVPGGSATGPAGSPWFPFEPEAALTLSDWTSTTASWKALERRSARDAAQLLPGQPPGLGPNCCAATPQHLAFLGVDAPWPAGNAATAGDDDRLQPDHSDDPHEPYCDSAPATSPTSGAVDNAALSESSNFSTASASVQSIRPDSEGHCSSARSPPQLSPPSDWGGRPPADPVVPERLVPSSEDACVGTEELFETREWSHTEVQAGCGRVLTAAEAEHENALEELQERLTMAAEEVAALAFCVSVMEQKNAQQRQGAEEAMQSCLAQHKAQVTSLRWQHADEITKLEEEGREAESRTTKLVEELTAQLTNGMAAAAASVQRLQGLLGEQSGRVKALEGQLRAAGLEPL